jgi:AhpD family alkylhydroperoxidase
MSSPRVSLPAVAREVYRAISALDRSVELDPALRELLKIRASQLNGCAYCIDLHARAARERGESERRIWALSAWREAPLFDERERAALALTEALTLVSVAGLPNDVYAEAARHFPDAELGNLIGAVISINAWNRLAIGAGMQPPVELDARE